MTIGEAIKARRSVRTFSRRELAFDPETEVEKFRADHNVPEVFNSRIRLAYIPNDPEQLNHGEKMGTYGVIKNHRGFLAGTGVNTNDAVLQFGYEVEKIILHLTMMGVGTCWLGGTFSRKSLSGRLSLEENEVIPAVIPLGYPEENKRPMEKMIRRLAGSDSRKEWTELFFDSDFTTPLTREAAGDLEAPLEMVRKGPSASNKQPWRVLLSEDRNRLHLYLDESPRYNSSLGYPIQMLDMGIAMCHLEAGFTDPEEGRKWEKANPGLSLPSENMKYIISYNRYS